MKIIIFDIDDAACALITSPNGYGMMIDCGCAAKDSDKENPIDVIRQQNKWLSIRPYTTRQGNSYPLTLLHITHPDDDHVRNASRVKSEFTPYLLKRVYIEQFPDAEKVNDEYYRLLDTPYRGSNPETINWGFEEDKSFSIPIEIVKSNNQLNTKIRNNASIIRYLKYGGISILFAGDMETPGWEWLASNDSDFVNTMKSGVNILIAPHHGHKSGFPKSLFDLTGNVDVIIHSKGSEGNIEGTDVASQYTNYAYGIVYETLNNKNYYKGNVLTTRSNGNIFIEIHNNRNVNYWTQKASSNHTLIK
ncbi:MAG: hypothetical protein LBE13_06645 [Bacteroidales bacterium]|jgi:beta-lactamase superfamily II metal-dependent hydrolase|nr:hypothetical protein [Bacteroidales bacterium]